jgi:hypothetical protein
VQDARPILPNLEHIEKDEVSADNIEAETPFAKIDPAYSSGKGKGEDRIALHEGTGRVARRIAPFMPGNDDPDI